MLIKLHASLSIITCRAPVDPTVQLKNQLFFTTAGQAKTKLIETLQVCKFCGKNSTVVPKSIKNKPKKSVWVGVGDARALKKKKKLVGFT